MATYGKKRHILPVMPNPGVFTTRTGPKRPKSSMRGYLTSTIYSSDMRGRDPPSHRDSIDELADFLLEDTIMDNCPGNQTIGVQSSGDVAMPDYHASKHSVHLENHCSALIPRVSSHRYLRNMKSVEDAQLDCQGIEETLAIKAGDLSTVKRGISQTRPFAPSWVNTNDNLQATAETRKEIKPDTSDFSPPEPYTPGDCCQEKTSKGLAKGANLDHQVERSKVVNSGPSFAQRGVSQPYPSGFNALDLNSKIEAMLAATKALKPDSTECLRPGVCLSANNGHLKDGNVLTKMKTAMNHHLQTLSNKKSPQPAEYLRNKDVLPQPTLTKMEIRMNEGDNLTNPKIVSLTGHGKIRRKPLPVDAKLLISQNSGSYRLAQSKSEPILELSSDILCSISEPLPTEDTTEPFPTYDTDYDVPFSSSPLAHSTPQIRAFEDRSAAMKVTHHDPRSFSNLSISNAHENSSGMELDFDGSEASGVTQRRPAKLKGSRPSARSGNGGRMKKHPSPSKAELEKWDQIICDFPPAKSSRTGIQACDNNGANVHLHPNSALGFKSANTKLQEPIGRQESGMEIDILQLPVPDTPRNTTTMDEVYNRNKNKKSFVSKHRNSKTRPREGSRGGRLQPSNTSIEDDIMDTDELQWDRPALMRKVT